MDCQGESKANAGSPRKGQVKIKVYKNKKLEGFGLIDCFNLYDAASSKYKARTSYIISKPKVFRVLYAFYYKTW